MLLLVATGSSRRCFSAVESGVSTNCADPRLHLMYRGATLAGVLAEAVPQVRAAAVQGCFRDATASFWGAQSHQ